MKHISLICLMWTMTLGFSKLAVSASVLQQYLQL